jgi:hypothetical protein
MGIAAQRGDLAVLVRTTRDYYTNRPAEDRVEAVICVVTSIKRDGTVSKVRDNWGGDPRPLRTGETALLVPRSEVDVEAAWAAGRAHVYPGHDQPKAFDSLDEAREAIRPFLRSVTT